MGNTPSTPVAFSATTTPTTATPTTTTPTTTTPINTIPATRTSITTTPTTTTPATNTAAIIATTTTSSPTTATSTKTTPTPTVINTTTATSTTPAAAITSTTPATIPKDTSTTPAATTEGTSKPTFYSIVKSVTSNGDQTKPAALAAIARWYKWSKFEQKQRDNGKTPWYMGPPVNTTDTPTATTPILTTMTGKITDDSKEASTTSNIAAVPSFQLRSTAVYSPPHGDRILSGRSELIDTDISNYKYYLPDNRSNQPVGNHTRATMYKMNTRLKQTPLPTQTLSSNISNPTSHTNITRDNSSLPTFFSRGQQTDLEAQPVDSSSTQIRYYEKQLPKIVPLSAFSNVNSNNNGFYHLASPSQPVLAPIEKTPVWINDQPRSSLSQSLPSLLPPPTRPSILKKTSKMPPQAMSDPLSSQTHDKVLEELRKQNKNTKDGTYRIKKIHLLEKSEPEKNPATVSFDIPRTPSTKASQSILRSERLFFS